MLGKRNIRDSVGYVTLGLFSHGVLDELFDAEPNLSKPPESKEKIELAIKSLSALNPSVQRRSPLHSDLIFHTHQERNALYRLLKKHPAGINRVEDLYQLLSSIVAEDAKSRERRQSVDKAIRFFTELARDAAISVEFPEDRIPSGVRRLAAQLTTT